MPKSPKGEKRPADVIGNATKAARITSGEETGEFEGPPEEERRRHRTGPKGWAQARRYHVGGAPGGDCSEGRREAVD